MCFFLLPPCLSGPARCCCSRGHFVSSADIVHCFFPGGSFWDLDRLDLLSLGDAGGTAAHYSMYSAVWQQLWKRRGVVWTLCLCASLSLLSKEVFEKWAAHTRLLQYITPPLPQLCIFELTLKHTLPLPGGSFIFSKPIFAQLWFSSASGFGHQDSNTHWTSPLQILPWRAMAELTAILCPIFLSLFRSKCSGRACDASDESASDS